MEKGNKKKRELQNALKMLATEKGYANVTMKDIGEYVGLSVGGLYHHYHSVDEIFSDLICKAGNHVKAKSMMVYMEKYDPVYAIRISARNFGMVNGIKSVPLYSTFCI